MTDNPNSEKRSIKRQQLFLYLKVYHEKTFFGYLTDISSEGLMVLRESPVELEKDFVLEIESKNELQSLSNPVFTARSIWTVNDVNPKYLITGFKFMEIDTVSLDTIGLLIDTYGFTA